MALGTSIYHADWATHHRGTLNSAMQSRIKIERTITKGKWDQASGTYTGQDIDVLYEGPAAIERIARPTRRDFVFDAADNQMMEVQIPLDPSLNEADPAPEDLRWQSNDLLTVLEDENPMAVGEKYFLRGWAPSSEDWAQTLYCGFNAKQDGA